MSQKIVTMQSTLPHDVQEDSQSAAYAALWVMADYPLFTEGRREGETQEAYLARSASENGRAPYDIVVGDKGISVHYGLSIEEARARGDDKVQVTLLEVSSPDALLGYLSQDYGSLYTGLSKGAPARELIKRRPTKTPPAGYIRQGWAKLEDLEALRDGSCSTRGFCAQLRGGYQVGVKVVPNFMKEAEPRIIQSATKECCVRGQFLLLVEYPIADRERPEGQREVDILAAGADVENGVDLSNYIAVPYPILTEAEWAESDNQASPEVHFHCEFNVMWLLLPSDVPGTIASIPKAAFAAAAEAFDDSEGLLEAMPDVVPLRLGSSPQMTFLAAPELKALVEKRPSEYFYRQLRAKEESLKMETVAMASATEGLTLRQFLLCVGGLTDLHVVPPLRTSVADYDEAPLNADYFAPLVPQEIS